MSKTISFKPDVVCDSCGKFGSFDFGDQNLCSDCYQVGGSCCMEFGGYDLWNDDGNKAGNKKGDTPNDTENNETNKT